jgi:hypothetical protein
MMTFLQFLESKEKIVNFYGIGSRGSNTPGKLMSRVINPSNLSVGSTYRGMLVPGKIYSRDKK